MPRRVSARIQDHFAPLTDPRRRKVTYPLINVVTIAVCAVICGADDFVAIWRSAGKAGPPRHAIWTHPWFLRYPLGEAV